VRLSSLCFSSIPVDIRLSVGWLHTRSITHLVLVFLSKSTGKTLERWTFDLHSTSSDSAPISASNDSAPAAIQNLLKQIPAAASFLPDLSEPAVFNILVYKRDESLPPSSSKEKVGNVKTRSKARPLEEGWRDVTEDAGTMAFEADTEVQNVSYATTRSGWSAVLNRESRPCYAVSRQTRPRSTSCLVRWTIRGPVTALFSIVGSQSRRVAMLTHSRCIATRLQCP
jgi:hypothetical protein